MGLADNFPIFFAGMLFRWIVTLVKWSLWYIGMRKRLAW